MAEKTKAELARRLRLSEADLISRADAASLTGVAAGTLLTKPNQHVGFFKLGEEKTARCLYRRDWVLAYAKFREGDRTTSYESWAKSAGKRMIGFGQQVWPADPGPKEISFKAVMLMINRWRYGELHRRIEDACTGRRSPDDIRDSLREESRILYDDEGRRRDTDDPELKPVLIEKARLIIQPAGVFTHPDRLAGIMREVWEQVLDTERGWLEYMR